MEVFNNIYNLGSSFPSPETANSVQRERAHCIAEAMYAHYRTISMMGGTIEQLNKIFII